MRTDGIWAGPQLGLRNAASVAASAPMTPRSIFTQRLLTRMPRAAPAHRCRRRVLRPKDFWAGPQLGLRNAASATASAPMTSRSIFTQRR